MVGLRVHRFGHARPSSVGADHDVGTLRDRCAFARATAHTHDSSVVDEQFADGEALA